MKIRATALVLISALLSSCQSLIHTEPSNLILVRQEVITLGDAQMLELIPRLQAYANGNYDMPVQHNGVPGDGSPFSLQMDIRKDKLVLIVTSPFEKHKFVFALYKDKAYRTTVNLDKLLNKIVGAVNH